MQDFRTHLDTQRPKAAEAPKVAGGSAETPQAPVAGQPKADQPEKTTQPPDLNQALENAESRRKTATQSALEVGALKHTQNLIDTYTDATSEDEEDQSPQITTIEPRDVYQAKMKYSRREDLVAAFELAGQGESSGRRLNMVV